MVVPFSAFKIDNFLLYSNFFATILILFLIDLAVPSVAFMIFPLSKILISEVSKTKSLLIF